MYIYLSALQLHKYNIHVAVEVNTKIILKVILYAKNIKISRQYNNNMDSNKLWLFVMKYKITRQNPLIITKKFVDYKCQTVTMTILQRHGITRH